MMAYNDTNRLNLSALEGKRTNNMGSDAPNPPRGHMPHMRPAKIDHQSRAART